jgi:CBS-domain-containing membrane protein
MRQLLVNAVTRRSGDFWRRLPLAKSLLEGEPVAPLLDPLPARLLDKEATFADAVNALNESATGALIVLDEKQRLWGTLDREDLYHIVARYAVTTTERRGDLRLHKLGDLLSGSPVYIALDDSAFVASAAMLDHGISWLPVVQGKDDLRPVGRLRGDRISRHLIEKIGHVPADRAQEQVRR